MCLLGPLPPELVWKRSFENLLEGPTVFEVPKLLFMQPVSPVVLSKRSWDLAFQQDGLPLLTWKEQEVPEVRPVARALFTAPRAVVQDQPQVQQVSDEDFSFSSQCAKKGRRPRKTLAPTPIVETSMRRCTRGSVQRDGFKPIFHELASQHKRKRPKSKPFTAVMSDDPAHGGTSVSVPPATPINRIQEIGQDLGIEDKYLTVEALTMDPHAAGNTNDDD